ncbi:MAG: G5 domain-containing protein, partial [Anaerolineae bacterium]|nr:G5 domain-containing protein [Anaerolineae bacterium]
GLTPGESRLAQLGVHGEEEITVRITYEDGQEVSRREISREMLVESVPEILVIGPQGDLPAFPIEGTIAYLSNGNAWLIRDNSDGRRALTTEGNLDGRVFALAPDGHQLLYTTGITDEIGLPLNELWLASTTIIGDAPTPLDIQGVLQAKWSPTAAEPTILYSTGERTAGPPGWRANNDLWLLSLPAELSPIRPPKPVQILPANTQGLYPWWGMTFEWSPDGQRLAYARADQIGIINLPLTETGAISGSLPVRATATLSDTATLSNSFVSLADFAPLQTFSEWVWVPGLSWSPDGRFIAATIHGPPVASEPAEESQVFDLWLLSIDGQIKAKVGEQVGMWANPAWSEAGIAFGEAVDPLKSVNSRYTIQLVDRDGSNKRTIFPFQNELGVQLPELVWSPAADQLLFVNGGNLFLTSVSGGAPRQITVDSQASHPQWVIPQSTITATIPITESSGLTSTNTLTDNIEVIPDFAATSAVRPTPIRLTPIATTTVTGTSTISATDIDTQKGE